MYCFLCHSQKPMSTDEALDSLSFGFSAAPQREKVGESPNFDLEVKVRM